MGARRGVAASFQKADQGLHRLGKPREADVIFLIFSGILAVFVVGLTLRPMLQRHDAQMASPDVAFYKAQLAELDNDVGRDLITPDEAERARAEIARRLIQADARSGSVTSDGQSRGAMLVSAGAVIGIAALTYWQIGAFREPDLPLAARLEAAADLRENRPDQAALEAAAPTPAQPDGLPESYLDQITQLRELVPQRPNDLRGWQLLSFHEAELRNFSSAAIAQEKVVSLKAEDATIDDQRLHMDYLVAAADGYVSHKAEAVARTILARDPENQPARYYLGALAHQTGRSDIAFRLWRPLVDSGQDSFHIALARLQIENAAALAGVDYTLPEIAGPTIADFEAAEDMAPEDREAMIMGMVAQLSDRLATQGGTASEWARLIGAYGVLGDTENARAIWTEAQNVFGSDAGAMNALRQAADQAGVLE